MTERAVLLSARDLTKLLGQHVTLPNYHVPFFLTNCKSFCLNRDCKTLRTSPWASFLFKALGWTSFRDGLPFEMGRFLR